MAKLPTAADLGISSPAPTRPTGTFDATPIARGAAAIGHAYEALGGAYAKQGQGIANLGSGIEKLGAGVGEYGQDQSRFQYAQAHSDFVSRKIDLDSAITQDQNYEPDAAGKDLPTRYTEQLNGIRNNSANLIQDPRWRELFM